ncbi:DMT family transporter [Metabacillus malikii]|uniref:Drug/metabolite transporter (DMT)-like permease n=1 Tax=Metabacillus malikii TaxID=1504265 RepID=A0ABT9Z9V4_9BACI|nr:DMT family transporter [Metabacillus malikii]MDQ0229034.1 drug/metabolite transporter (DMT)-like permease [Metabacillus malikii]
MKNNVLVGAILCFIAAASWGAMFPVAHAAFKHIDPFYFTIIRYGAVTVILVAMLLWKEGKQAFRFEGKGVKLWFFGTMAFTVYNLLIFWGEDLLGSSGVMVASIMESLMPMISIVIVWMLYKRRPYRFTLLCVLISFIGALFVITKGNINTFLSATDSLFPTLLIFIAVIGWVIYTMGGSEFRGWSVLRYSTLSCLLGTVTAIVIVVGATMLGMISVPTVNSISEVGYHLLFMIIFPGVIALLGWNVGVSILSPLNGLLFINFVPVTTLAISIFQGNPVTRFDLIGTVFIIVALLANNLYVRMLQRKKSNQSVQATLQSSST